MWSLLKTILIAVVFSIFFASIFYNYSYFIDKIEIKLLYSFFCSLVSMFFVFLTLKLVWRRFGPSIRFIFGFRR